MNKQNLPEDPIIRELVQHARAAQISRRALLGGAFGGAIALSLAACAPGEQALVAAEDISDSDPTVNWANWPLYLDEDDAGNYPTLEAFTAATTQVPEAVTDSVVPLNEHPVVPWLFTL
jgi:spermidine/putrescine transport system substrate-binding protein